MELISGGCTALVAVVFGFAAVGKLRGRSAWADFVATTGAMLPTRRRPAVPVAVVVVGAEIAITLLAVVSLVTGAAAVGVAAFCLAAVLLVAFLAAIAGVLRSGRSVRCRCFGSGGAVFGRNHLVRNGILLLIVACGLVAGGHAQLNGPAFVAAAGGVVCGLFLAYWDELAFLVLNPVKA
jgi:hypothetical protein